MWSFPWLGYAACYRGKDAAATADDFVADTELVNVQRSKTVNIGGKKVVKKQTKKKKNPIGEAKTKENPIA